MKKTAHCLTTHLARALEYGNVVALLDVSNAILGLVANICDRGTNKRWVANNARTTKNPGL